MPDESDPRTETQKEMYQALAFQYDDDWHNYRDALSIGRHVLDGRHHQIGNARCCDDAEPLYTPEEQRAGRDGRPRSDNAPRDDGCRDHEHERRLVEWGRDKPFRNLMQFDGFAAHPGCGDYVIRRDEEGYAVMVGESVDPRRTAEVDWIPVRVQIAWGTQTQTVLDLLDRIRDCVAQGGVDLIGDPVARGADDDIDFPPGLPF